MAGQSASLDDQDDVNTSFIKNHEHGDHIRKSNQEAYTPQVISFGPFHRNNPKLQKMEDFKLSYLKSFMERADPEMKLKDLVRTIKGAEESVRECYSETIPLESDDFVKMILVDASFIIQYFWKNMTKVNWTEYDREILEPGLCNRIQMDLILLENQLPFFIIKKIYEIAFPSFSKQHPFIELTFRQFEYYNVQNSKYSVLQQILHFTHLLRNFCMPPCKWPRPEESFALSIKEMHSATQLDEVGLKFKMSNNRSPLELKYADGVLEIPRFQIDDTTEIYARNLVAWEKCRYPKGEAYVTDYYTFLTFLTRTGKDLDVLVREQIIDNWLDDVVATSMINKLSGEKDFYYQMNSHYGQLAEGLSKFYNNSPKLIPLIRVLFRGKI
ncbi:hypothetical protein I3843_15G108200 [Carya illinoinensis]|nr:hypothetical protein I3843_15G108200 [Carya illinoinensis]KAG7944562.1 hypothetical protein I3843_15G108200 [Carya illinoinensis]